MVLANPTQAKSHLLLTLPTLFPTLATAFYFLLSNFYFLLSTFYFLLLFSHLRKSYIPT